MAKLFIGLALALMLATAALGFLAKGNIDKLQSSVKGAKAELQTEQGKTRTAVTEQKKAVEEKDAAVAKADEATKALESKVVEATTAKQEAETAKTALEAKTKELAEMTLNASKVPVDNKPVGDDPRIAALTAEVQKAQADLAEAKQVIESTANRSKENDAKLADLQRKDAARQKQVAIPGLQGRILAVNSGWNFVVLSIGDKQGIVVNAPLLVVRGNEPIARLRITSVEPSTSIADVIPGSVRRGVTVQPGDTIIVEGRNPAILPKSAPGQPEPAAASSPLPN